MINEEFLEKHFYHKLYDLNTDTILKLNKVYNDPCINDVVVGRQSHLYGLGLIEENKPTDYQLYYINGDGGLSGKVLKLNIDDPNRDVCLIAFAMHIADIYELDVLDIFNTYQESIASTFENLGYLAIKANELMEFKNKNPVVVAKGVKGILILPYLFHKDLYQFLFGMVDIVKPLTGDSYVYLMHDSKNNYIKIGKSRNPKHREKTLQAEAPEITMIAVWKASDKLERHLHTLFKHKRMRGEWFQLTFKELKEIKNHVNAFIAQELKMTN